MTPPADLPRTLGQLRKSEAYSEARVARRSVKDEIRANLIRKLRADEPLFPGIVGYDDTVVPQIVNALLSRHDFILLGLRGQAKSRILRQLTTLLDPWLPFVAGSEIHDNPYRPLSKFGRDAIAEQGDATAIDWLTPDERYVEKLATPDVTIADMIGDLDPIKAARGAHHLADEITIHFGLLPRANRGIFAINELPDLMGKIQVGLFNILQEGDVQIKGYPIRLALDVMMVFSANPEDYTARGKIITPLKDRIGSEIRTHYPLDVDQAVEITRQEAWTDRGEATLPLLVPDYIRSIVEQIAFVAREDSKIDKRSGVSQRLPISCMENVVSNAERRALLNGEALVVPRVADVYAAMPSITGKFELEYEGELRGAERVAHEMIRAAVARAYDETGRKGAGRQIVQWFEMGGTLKLAVDAPAAQVVEQLQGIQGVFEATEGLLPEGRDEPEALASAGEFVLDGLYAHRRLTRSEEVGYAAQREKPKKPQGGRRASLDVDDFGPTFN
ncbi:MAG: magnesium chelatase [Acidobacteria bacterium]|nr:magnesium chelatase [Acidobacteriota bacterium]